MSRLPSFQFYPEDWLGNANLRRCSHAAKGAWIDVLCLMHQSDERGALITNGVPWPLEDVAAALGNDQTISLACLRELLSKGVARIDKRGALISGRMIRDEMVRQVKAQAGTLGMAKRWINNKHHNKTITDQITNIITKSGSSVAVASAFVPPNGGMLANSPAGPPMASPTEQPPGKFPLESIRRVVRGFKIKMRIPEDDKAWDRAYFRRYSAAAKGLLGLLGGDVGKCADCIEAIADRMDGGGLSWQPETIMRHAGDWKHGRLFK